jgi:protein-tyrosine phosphatase
MVFQFLKKGQAEREAALRDELENADFRLLFVCMGNICRSPTAEGVFRRVLERDMPDTRVFVDSAGTHAYHVGEPPDRRAQAAARRRGVDLSEIRARRVTEEDFERFDLIVAMDRLNVAVLRDVAPAAATHRIRLFLEFASSIEREDVPDPYYGGTNGFEYVLDLAEEAAAGLAAHIRAEIRRR